MNPHLCVQFAIVVFVVFNVIGDTIGLSPYLKKEKEAETCCLFLERKPVTR